MCLELGKDVWMDQGYFLKSSHFFTSNGAPIKVSKRSIGLKSLHHATAKHRNWPLWNVEHGRRWRFVQRSFVDGPQSAENPEQTRLAAAIRSTDQKVHTRFQLEKKKDILIQVNKWLSFSQIVYARPHALQKRKKKDNNCCLNLSKT